MVRGIPGDSWKSLKDFELIFKAAAIDLGLMDGTQHAAAMLILLTIPINDNILANIQLFWESPGDPLVIF